MKRLTIATLAISLALGANMASAETIWEYVIRLATGGSKAPGKVAAPAAAPVSGITSDPASLTNACQHWLTVRSPKSGTRNHSVAARMGEASCQSYIQGFFGGSIASGKRDCPTTKYENDYAEISALVKFLDGWGKRPQPFTDKGAKFTSGMMLGLFIYEGVLCDVKAGK